MVSAKPSATPVTEQPEASTDPYWARRRLSPSQLQVFDVQLTSWRGLRRPEISELLPSSFTPPAETRDRLAESVDVNQITDNRAELLRISNLLQEFGWMNELRITGAHKDEEDPENLKKCRWIHISSKFTEYLRGALVGLSDWSQSPKNVNAAYTELVSTTTQNERFSKHGKYFTPFFQRLRNAASAPANMADEYDCPLLLSVPFLDWSVRGPKPPLRFWIDSRESRASSRSSNHMLRSILQHFYKLEDTRDREKQQVFYKHRPWASDRDLDLKVRRWYGRYPNSLDVDELWILIVDSRHIVSFSSNQSWKSRFPPLVLASRIAHVSFRENRNLYYSSPNKQHDYTSHAHAIACLSGAIGLLHRSFWQDIPLCVTDRYAGYLGHLQYRLHRSPNTKLVMDLMHVQDELAIVLQIAEQQLELVTHLREFYGYADAPVNNISSYRAQRIMTTSTLFDSTPSLHHRQSSFSGQSLGLESPISAILDNLNREYSDLVDLRNNCNSLVTRTVQLVNIRLEDHGKAILVFTIVTIIFLPLSFLTSYFGMNLTDIRGTTNTQKLFWTVAGALTVAVVTLVLFMAFYGAPLAEFVSHIVESAGKVVARRVEKRESKQLPVDVRSRRFPAWKRGRPSREPARSNQRLSTFSVLGSMPLERDAKY